MHGGDWSPSTRPAADVEAQAPAKTDSLTTKQLLALLRASTAWCLTAVLTLLVAVVAMIIHITQARKDSDSGGDDTETAGAAAECGSYLALKEQHDKAKLWYTACALVLVCSSVPPLVKASRDRSELTPPLASAAPHIISTEQNNREGSSSSAGCSS